MENSENVQVRKRRKGVPAEVFVEVFGQVAASSGTYSDVATQLGVNTSEVVARASKLRSLGVNLAELKSEPRKRLNVAALNQRYQEIVSNAVNS